MVKLVPARLENGAVVPEGPLPAASEVRSVSILLEVREPSVASGKESTLPRLLGILKVAPEDGREQYRQQLEPKYG